MMEIARPIQLLAPEGDAPCESGAFQLAILEVEELTVLERSLREGLTFLATYRLVKACEFLVKHSNRPIIKHQVMGDEKQNMVVVADEIGRASCRERV